MSSNFEKILIAADETKPVFVVWTQVNVGNDRQQIPLNVCDSQETALRMSKAAEETRRVSTCQAIKVNGLWMVPGYIIPETTEDRHAAINRKKKETIIQKALDSGLTLDEVKLLSS